MYIVHSRPLPGILFTKRSVAAGNKSCTKGLSISILSISSTQIQKGFPEAPQTEIQSLSDIVTTLGTRQNSHNIQYLSQGDKIYCIRKPNQRRQVVIISDICHRVVVTIYGKDCIQKWSQPWASVAICEKCVRKSLHAISPYDCRERMSQACRADQYFRKNVKAFVLNLIMGNIFML